MLHTGNFERTDFKKLEGTLISCSALASCPAEHSV